MSRVAVVGGGISGMVATHLLSRRDEVTLFEAGERLGGHTLTVEVDTAEGEDGGGRQPVDMGFIVHNDRNYPGFVRLMDELGVKTADSEMSFSVRCERRDIEWNGSSLDQVFGQRSNLLRPSHWSMVLGILRFHRRAPAVLEQDDDSTTFGEYLEREGFRGPVVDRYLVPMASAIWSTESGRVLDYPIRTLVAFFANHGMLQVKGRPRWRYIPGGSSTYIAAFERCWAEQERPVTVRTQAPVTTIRREAEGVEIVTRDGEAERFDHVVIATHSDQALAMLRDATATERQVLGAITYQDNEVVLHTDRRFLPRRPKVWASWNAHLGTRGGGAQLTYYMNRLQRIDSPRPFLVTLNRTDDIDPATILERRTMAHPLYTREAVAAQKRWAEVSRGRTFFCGAYWGWGFHEDGVQSARRVAEALGVSW